MKPDGGNHGNNPAFFLFCEEISSERLRWLSDCLKAVYPSQTPGSAKARSESPSCTIFLTGDSLMSLIDRRTREIWKSLSEMGKLEVHADGDELLLHGIKQQVAEGLPAVSITGNGHISGKDEFWNTLVSDLKKNWDSAEKAAFLLCNSPYMSRTPVYMLKFLGSAVNQGLDPEMYAYLDGVHSGHIEQRPSEFENIGAGISDLSGSAARSGRASWFSACSRCATARGYYVKNARTGECESWSYIDSVTIRPLKEILERFSGNHPILSHTCGGIICKSTGAKGDDKSTKLLIFLTNSPYATEWTFGGISMGVAAAMDGIETHIIFIEQGVYSLCGDHEVRPGDRVFNIQEMIMATADIPEIHYCAFSASLDERGMEITENLTMVEMIDSKELGERIWGNSGDKGIAHTKVIFY